MESDFLLMILRELLGRRADLRLVLMSATLNAGLFSGYFSHSGKGGGAAGVPRAVPTVRMPGRTHAVTPLFLEEVLDLTQVLIPLPAYKAPRRARCLYPSPCST